MLAVERGGGAGRERKRRRTGKLMILADQVIGGPGDEKLCVTYHDPSSARHVDEVTEPLAEFAAKSDRHKAACVEYAAQCWWCCQSQTSSMEHYIFSPILSHGTRGVIIVIRYCTSILFASLAP